MKSVKIGLIVLTTALMVFCVGRAVIEQNTAPLLRASVNACIAMIMMLSLRLDRLEGK